MNKKQWFGIVMAACAVLALTAPALADANNDDRTFSPDSVAYGRTMGDWSAAWWQWAWSIPDGVHLLLDSTGSDVGEEQSGPVL